MNALLNYYRFSTTFSALCFMLLLASCQQQATNAEDTTATVAEEFPEPVAIDLSEIKKDGKLTAITAYSATSYFVYRGTPMGYEYELLQRLADHLDLELEIKIANNLDSFIYMLNRGEGDLVAHNLTITKERLQHVDFTAPHNTTKQVLVQRKPDDWRSMKVHQIEAQMIRDPNDLIGKPVHVRQNSAYYKRLKNLSEEIGGDIEIIPEEGNLSTEHIIKKVAEGDYDFTVADQQIAELNFTYYPNIDIETAIGFPQRLAWMVRKTSPELKQAIDEWITEAQQSADYYVIYNKYFKNKKAFQQRVSSEYFSLEGGKISSYDDVVKTNAKLIGWDWKLLSSQIYQESKFDPQTKSWAGALGLMQLLPKTANEFGNYDLLDPTQSIEAGTHYIQYLENQFKDITDPAEKQKFVLASYNAGLGHVEDARALARKNGKNPDIWSDNVDQYILLKAQQQYYEDPVVKHGYCRGEEPYNYVIEILKRYQTYQELFEEKKSVAMAES